MKKQQQQKRSLRRKAFSGSIHNPRVEEKRKLAIEMAKEELKHREMKRTLSGMLKDDIALYLSPLTAVAGEFRRRLRGT